MRTLKVLLLLFSKKPNILFLIIVFVVFSYSINTFLIIKSHNAEDKADMRSKRSNIERMHQIDVQFKMEEQYEQPDQPKQTDQSAQLDQQKKIDQSKQCDQPTQPEQSGKPIIFIAGQIRSGTTLMRSLLDTHDKIFCGTETYILSMFLNTLKNYWENKNIHKRTHRNNNMTREASSLFIRKILENNLKPSEILCAKDPTITYNLNILRDLFPDAHYLLMIRDGRATSYSVMEKSKLEITEQTFLKTLKKWNSLYRRAINDCENMTRCKVVRYEDLVLNTESVMRNVSQFLGIEYTDRFLNHTEFIGEKIILEKDGWSSDQVSRKIYTDSLRPWVGKVVYDKKFVSTKLEMMSKFGYEVDFNDTSDGSIVTQKPKMNQAFIPVEWFNQ